MAKYGSYIKNEDVKFKKKQRRRFKRFIIERYYKQQIARIEQQEYTTI